MSIGEDIKITPYKCRTLYYEYQELRNRKKNIVDFIIKADLLDLYKELEPNMGSNINMAEFVHVCMTVFMKIETLYSNTTEPFQNYLDGIGTIKSCNETSSWRGERSCQEEIVAAKLTSSYILSYIHFSIVNNKTERNKLNKSKLIEEVIKERASITSENIEQALSTIHVKVKETNDLMAQIRQINSNFEANDIMLMLENMQTKLDTISKTGKESSTEKGLLGIKQNLEIADKKLNDLGEASLQAKNKYDILINELLVKMKNENSKIDGMRKMHSDSIAETQNKEIELKNLAQRMDSSVNEIQNMLSGNGSLSSILDTVRTVDKYIFDLQQGVRQQSLETKEIDSKVSSIEEGVSIIKKVLNSLNTIMREDILIGLARTKTDLDMTVDEVQILGTRYKGMRNGGIDNGNIN